MIILIDGYNLLKQIFPGVKGRLDKQRGQLAKQLAYYKFKNEKIKEIVLVFDGGVFNHATREIRRGVAVVFSGRKASADDWILSYVKRNKNKQILLISLDRELRTKTEKFGVDSLNVFDFYKILQNCLQEDVAKVFSKKFKDDTLKKNIDKNNHIVDEFYKKKIDSKALDLLMEESSLKLNEFSKNDDYLDNEKRSKGKSKTLSRKEKRYYSKIKKL